MYRSDPRLGILSYDAERLLFGAKHHLDVVAKIKPIIKQQKKDTTTNISIKSVRFQRHHKSMLTVELELRLTSMFKKLKSDGKGR